MLSQKPTCGSVAVWGHWAKLFRDHPALSSPSKPNLLQNVVCIYCLSFAFCSLPAHCNLSLPSCSMATASTEIFSGLPASKSQEPVSPYSRDSAAVKLAAVNSLPFSPSSPPPSLTICSSDFFLGL